MDSWDYHKDFAEFFKRRFPIAYKNVLRNYEEDLERRKLVIKVEKKK